MAILGVDDFKSKIRGGVHGLRYFRSHLTSQHTQVVILKSRVS